MSKPRKSLDVLFAPFGSEGDVNPLFWLAQGLAQRGHHPLFLLSPHYGPLADRFGFSWVPVGSEADFLTIARDPRIWNRRRGPELVVRSMLKSIPAYRLTMQKLDRSFDLVVTSTVSIPAATIAESMHIPQLTLHLQPVCFRSEFACPLFSPDLAWLVNAPRWMKRLFFRTIDAVAWLFIQRPLNRFRKELGLAPISKFYQETVHRYDASAAMFPDWFAPPQGDWPRGTRQFGFPLTLSSLPLSADLESWLQAGPPPIVWTHGSANFHVDLFQKYALAVCERLGVRCLLVSLQPPPPLPSYAFHVTHCRFDDLFPRCAAVVHHGGIGTTAKAIAAATPQLVIPRSHDQPDNAARVVRLNLGRTLSYEKLSLEHALPILSELLSSPAIKASCLDFQSRILTSTALDDLCLWAESLALSTSP